MKPIAVIGYSGHAYVAIDAIESSGMQVDGYFELQEKLLNPFGLKYLGKDALDTLIQMSSTHDYFIGIGDNLIRRKIWEANQTTHIKFVNAIHSSAILGSYVKMGAAVLIAPFTAINALTTIGNGVICNTGSIIEHECNIADFVHIAPGAVLCGNVTVGENTFIGANSVIKQGVTVGNNVTIGAGSIVLKDVAEHTVVIGNPGKKN